MAQPKGRSARAQKMLLEAAGVRAEPTGRGAQPAPVRRCQLGAVGSQAAEPRGRGPRGKGCSGKLPSWRDPEGPSPGDGVPPYPGAKDAWENCPHGEAPKG